MRIIAGYLGGRQFLSPGTNRTHPMSEKVRGAVFNVLGDISGLTVLDVFAGSGALAFEAISRGAKHVLAIDIDKRAITTVVKTNQQLGIENKITALRANSSSWSDKNAEKLFDLVFCDPPYGSIRSTLIIKMSNHVKIGGVVVISSPEDFAINFLPNNFELLANKSYGSAKLYFFRKTS